MKVNSDWLERLAFVEEGWVTRSVYQLFKLVYDFFAFPFTTTRVQPHAVWEYIVPREYRCADRLAVEAEGYDDEDSNYDEVQVDEADDPRN